MALKKICFGLLVLPAFFLGCSSDPNPDNFNYLRGLAYVKADTAVTDHDFCASTPNVFASEAECRTTKKYRLTWVRPEDTTDFLGYRLYVDTVPPNAPARKNWEYVRGRGELASVIVTSIAPMDSLVFIFGKSDSLTATGPHTPDTLKRDTKRIFVIDTTLRQETEDGRLVFALVPVYSEKTPPGQPWITWFVTNDKKPPDVFSPLIKPMARKVEITWERPTDPTSFFDASLDTGIISNYELEITLQGRTTPDRKKNFKPAITYFRGGVDLTKSVRDSLVLESTDNIPLGHAYFLPDTNRARKVKHTLQDSLTAVIDGLTPQDTLKLLLWAVDSAGNRNINAMQSVVVHLTDTTQPSKPVLSKDTSLKSSNTFVVRWQASRDTISDPKDGKLREADSANFFIGEYRLRRTLIRGPQEKSSLVDQMDTVIHVVSGFNGNGGTALFLDTMRFLPPGRSFLLRLTAVDSSGFESLADTLTFATDSVSFTGADSALQCPQGFVRIPRGHFILGETVAGFSEDEKPAKDKKMDPYCIEPYEHRDSSGRFASNSSWQQADSTCRNLGLDTAFHSALCSEAEWERACEGSGTGGDSALTHGIQSELRNASILQSSCNQGTNDSVMAKSFDLRNSSCLTREGVYDMAGNYSEWIRDPYDSSAYGNAQYPDSLGHDFTYANPSGWHAFRGGNFLKPSGLPISTLQSLARCSNRDFAAQVRPKFRSDCLDSVRKIAVIYGPGLSGHFCMAIPDSLAKYTITDMIPHPTDTSKALAFVQGSTQPKAFDIPKDTIFKGRKPQQVQLTTRSLALVTFVRPGTDRTIPDTLDATEMKDTSQAGLGRIFARESGKSGWSPRKDGDRFAIRYLFAYTIMGTKPAKDYYTSQAIAFRCCSLAAAPPPVTSPIVASPKSGATHSLSVAGRH